METFKLANDKPKRKRLDVPNITGRQKMLLSGLDCDKNQIDLFHEIPGEDDGQPIDDEKQSDRRD